jgi:triacylglycerol lipase
MNQFQPSAIDFNFSNAYAMVQASSLAYQDAEAIEAQAIAWGFPKVKFLSSGPTQGYLMANDHAIVLAFRGTEGKNRKDWLTNLNFDRTETHHGDVHEGFSKAVDRVWELLWLNLLKFRTAQQPLFITGHSLGGALATLSALRFASTNQPVQALYTFGSPRVGDRTYLKHFTEALGDRAFRLVNDEDVVAKVPLKAMGYCHVGEKYRFDSTGKLWQTSRSQTLLERIQDEVEDLVDPDWELIEDHALSAYRDRILANLFAAPIG